MLEIFRFSPMIAVFFLTVYSANSEDVKYSTVNNTDTSTIEPAGPKILNCTSANCTHNSYGEFSTSSYAPQNSSEDSPTFKQIQNQKDSATESTIKHDESNKQTVDPILKYSANANFKDNVQDSLLNKTHQKEEAESAGLTTTASTRANSARIPTTQANQNPEDVISESEKKELANRGAKYEEEEEERPQDIEDSEKDAKDIGDVERKPSFGTGTTDSAISKDDNISENVDHSVQLSPSSISAVDQIATSSRGASATEEIMYIDLQDVGDYLSQDMSSQSGRVDGYSHYTKYSFQSESFFRWSTESSQNKISLTSQSWDKTSDVLDNGHFINPTRVLDTTPLTTEILEDSTISDNLKHASSSIVGDEHKDNNILTSSFRSGNLKPSLMTTPEPKATVTKNLGETTTFFVEKSYNVPNEITTPKIEINATNYILGSTSKFPESSTSRIYDDVFSFVEVDNATATTASHDLSENVNLTKVPALFPTEKTVSPPLTSEIKTDTNVASIKTESNSIIDSLNYDSEVIETPIISTTLSTESINHSTEALSTTYSQTSHTPNVKTSVVIEETAIRPTATIVEDLSSVTFTETIVPVVSPTMPQNVLPPCALIKAIRSPPAKQTTAETKEDKDEEETVKEMKLPTYVRMHLAQNWSDFCKKRAKLKSRFSNAFSKLGKESVDPNRFVFASDTACNQSRKFGHSKGISVYVYTLDKKGNYSESLTTKLEEWMNKRIKQAASYDDEVDREICEVKIYKSREDTKTVAHEISRNLSSSGMIAAITISAIAGICLMLMFTMLLILKQRREKDQGSTSSSDSYSMDSFSARGSNRRKKPSRLSIRSFLNQAFDEPELPNHPLNLNNLNSSLQNHAALEEEFKNIPMDVPKLESLPPGVEAKNRYANVIPVPETRVPLHADDEHPGYINANYVRGYGGKTKAYIAAQAPLPETMEDFWRMVWEQQSRVIVMLTPMEENGMSRCAPYFPENTVDCHKLYGDFQVTLLEKDMRETFIKSTFRLHDLEKNLFRDIHHVWYTSWPAQGLPVDQGAFLSCILEIRTLLAKNSGPLIVHCSTGTGKTGTFIAIDICMHEFQESRCVDVMRCVARLRQDRNGSVQTSEQYIFIHEILHEYAVKLGNQSHRPSLMSLVSLKLSHQER